MGGPGIRGKQEVDNGQARWKPSSRRKVKRPNLTTGGEGNTRTTCRRGDRGKGPDKGSEKHRGEKTNPERPAQGRPRIEARSQRPTTRSQAEKLLRHRKWGADEANGAEGTEEDGAKKPGRADRTLTEKAGEKNGQNKAKQPKGPKEKKKENGGGGGGSGRTFGG